MSDPTKQHLVALLKPEAWAVSSDAEGALRYPDGSYWSDPTAFPIQLRRLLGKRVEIYGFWAFENPEASNILEVSERHDFSIVDGRWIIDPWAASIRGASISGLIDRNNSTEDQKAFSTYGPPQLWERSAYLEQYADYQSTPASIPSNGSVLLGPEDFDMQY